MAEPEILTLEEMREAAQACLLRPTGKWAARFVARLCATVEHYANKLAEGTEHIFYCEQCDRWQDNRVGCEADVRFDERQKVEAEGAAERDHLRSLVAGMREEVSGVRFLLDTLRQDAHGGPRFSHLMSRAGTMVDARPLADRLDALLADPDGQRVHYRAAKDREDAEKWRALMVVKDETSAAPEYVARVMVAIGEADEELQLLRAWESARRSVAVCEEKCRTVGADPARILLATATADAAERVTWQALCAFRARQKEAARG